jgi:L-threonylcarbamoyladenylate synthase
LRDSDQLSKSIQTHRFHPQDLVAISQVLRQRGVVAVPTETVYGLAADARNDDAVARIFQAKQRPAENPLIVHLAGADDLESFAAIEHQWIWDCIERFSPGPISYVLPYRGGLATQVTAGLSTVAVRFPKHETFQNILHESGLALAAPSANLSGRPSATTWQSVLVDLEDRIEGVVCDMPCQWGLESTVIDATTDTPIVLRPGAISLEELKSVVPHAQHVVIEKNIQHRSPGTRFKHYQPVAQVRIVNDIAAGLAAFEHKRCAVIRVLGSEQIDAPNAGLIENCSDLAHYAQRLFEFFREADAAGCDVVLCQCVAEVGIGHALMDRIRRAATG